MPKFTPGLKISKQFYNEIIAPIMRQDFPDLVYSAALIGPGSEVLGFDTALSVDHDWRPRVYIFLSSFDFQNCGQEVEKVIRKKLPSEYMGFPTLVPESDDIRSRFVYSVHVYVEKYLGFNLDKIIVNNNWLTFSEQCLKSFVCGEVFHNGLKELNDAREKFLYYPKDVWLYVMASEWMKISQEQPFLGRTGDIGDDIGSRLLVARIVHTIMRLCFYIEKKYIPYSKWFGGDFDNLSCAELLKPMIENVLRANSWRNREMGLAPMFEIVINLHNELGVTKPINTKMHNFHDRPYLVIDSDEIVTGLMNAIQDEKLKTLPLIGSVNQFTTSADFIDDSKVREKAVCLYQPS
jgi:hypothetical protein